MGLQNTGIVLCAHTRRPAAPQPVPNAQVRVLPTSLQGNAARRAACGLSFSKAMCKTLTGTRPALLRRHTLAKQSQRLRRPALDPHCWRLRTRRLKRCFQQRQGRQQELRQRRPPYLHQPLAAWRTAWWLRPKPRLTPEPRNERQRWRRSAPVSGAPSLLSGRAALSAAAPQPHRLLRLLFLRLRYLLHCRLRRPVRLPRQTSWQAW